MRVRAISWPQVDLWPRRGDDGLVRTLAPIVVMLEAGLSVTVPRFFWSDGASVPSPAWAVLRSGPLRLILLGIVHDYAVRRLAVLQRRGLPPVPFTVSGATALALAVADHYAVGEYDRAMIGAALALAAPSYWQKRPIEWRPQLAA